LLELEPLVLDQIPDIIEHQHVLKVHKPAKWRVLVVATLELSVGGQRDAGEVRDLGLR
jgi:hypothetical protein